MDGSYSLLEERSLLTAVLVTVGAVAAAVVRDDPGGLARAMGLLALAGVALVAISRGVRQYRAGMPASLPTSVARVRVATRPARALSLVTVGLALVLPLVLAVALLALTEWAWLLIVAVLLVGYTGVHLSATPKPVGPTRGHLSRPRRCSTVCACGLTCRSRNWRSRATSWRTPGPRVAGSISPPGC